MHPKSHRKTVLTTGQFAEAIGHSAKTIRTYHFRKGAAFGIRPRKVGRLLLWPSDQVAALLDGSNEQQGA